MDRLILICEGGIHTVEYLQRNGIFPGALVIEPNRFKDMTPYLTKEDEILLIIKGLTDFTMASVYGVLNKFKEIQSKIKKITILTNIPLGNIDFEYYLYDGDIFYGGVQKVVGKKKIDIDFDGELIDNSPKLSFFKKGPVKTTEYNPIMFQFKKYNDRKVKMMIYGSFALKDSAPVTQLEYEEKIKVVDLYKNSNGGII